jgi:hypothetical protein
MLIRLFSLPFIIAFRIVSMTSGSLRIIMSTAFKITGFIFKNIPGIALGVAAGIVLGKKQFR